jgi:hypothetical protein
MELCDRTFTIIKQLESNDQLEEVINNLSRTKEKSEAMYSKLYSVKNQIDNFQSKIDKVRTTLMNAMEESCETQALNKRTEKKNRVKSENTAFKLNKLKTEVEIRKTMSKQLEQCAGRAYKEYLKSPAAIFMEKPTFEENVEFEDIGVGKYLAGLEIVAKNLISVKDEKFRRWHEENARRLNLPANRIAGLSSYNTSLLKNSQLFSKSRKNSEILALENIEKIGNRGKKSKSKSGKNESKSLRGRSQVKKRKRLRKGKNWMVKEFSGIFDLSAQDESKSVRKRDSIHEVLNLEPGALDSSEVEIQFGKDVFHKKYRTLLDLNKFKHKNRNVFKKLNLGSNLVSIMGSKLKSKSLVFAESNVKRTNPATRLPSVKKRRLFTTSKRGQSATRG